MSKYRIIYKKNGLFYHQHIEAKNIDDVYRYIRENEGKDAILIFIRKETT